MTGALPLAVTRGDPSGIGLELVFKAWQDRDSGLVSPFFLVADLAHCRRASAALGLTIPFVACAPSEALALFATALPVIPLDIETIGRPGQPDLADAPGTIAAMERAVALVAQGEASGVVTLPISKEILHRVGYAYPGQTEFMGALAERHWGVVARPVMLIWSPVLSVVPTTIHIPLADVPRALTADRLAETIRIVDADFRARFGLEQPRIAVAGLNPHAGEGGDIGREEIEWIIPLIHQLRDEGLALSGPHPADTLFHAAARSAYDVAVTMYHDQGLIPVKTLAFDSGVNTTLGLPFVRTSPDHGTAFDIAGRGIASPTSFIAALNLAARLTKADRARTRDDATRM